MSKKSRTSSEERIVKQIIAECGTCVPVLGSGVNIQAAVIDKQKNTDDWEGLLRKVAKQIGMSVREFRALPTSNVMRWETMLRQCAVARRIDPHKAENALQKLVCEELGRQERASKSWKLYGEFRAARFSDIISLNFDRRTALHGEGEKFHVMARAKGRRAADEPIYRHSVVTHADGAETCIWYPHGDTKKASTLKFGVRKYGDYIDGLERQRKWVMSRWSEATKGAGRTGLLPPREFDAIMRRGNSGRHLTWPAVFLTSPLMFIGCSLALDEWPLWWLLHQRARIFARFAADDVPATVCLCVGDVPDQLTGKPCNLQVVKFPTFESLWGAIRESLAQRSEAVWS